MKKRQQSVRTRRAQVNVVDAEPFLLVVEPLQGGVHGFDTLVLVVVVGKREQDPRLERLDHVVVPVRGVLLVATTGGDVSRGALVSFPHDTAAAEGVALSYIARRHGGAGLQERAPAGDASFLLVFAIFIAVDARLAAIQHRPWQLLLDALRLLRGHLATARGRGSLQGPRGGRRPGDDGVGLLGHDGCAARKRRGALVCGSTRRARAKKKRVKRQNSNSPRQPQSRHS